MNELKNYLKQRIDQYEITRPASYEESFFQSIKTSTDVENAFQRTEREIKSYEGNSHPGYLVNVEERQLAIYKAYTALKKAVTCLSEISILPSKFDSISREQFDSWFDQLDDLCRRNEKLNSKFASRPDGM